MPTRTHLPPAASPASAGCASDCLDWVQSSRTCLEVRCTPYIPPTPRFWPPCQFHLIPSSPPLNSVSPLLSLSFPAGCSSILTLFLSHIFTPPSSPPPTSIPLFHSFLEFPSSFTLTGRRGKSSQPLQPGRRTFCPILPTGGPFLRPPRQKATGDSCSRGGGTLQDLRVSLISGRESFLHGSASNKGQKKKKIVVAPL